MSTPDPSTLTPRLQAFLDVLPNGYAISLYEVKHKLDASGFGIGPGDVAAQANYLRQLGFVTMDTADSVKKV